MIGSILLTNLVSFDILDFLERYGPALATLITSFGSVLLLILNDRIFHHPPAVPSDPTPELQLASLQAELVLEKLRHEVLRHKLAALRGQAEPLLQ